VSTKPVGKAEGICSAGTRLLGDTPPVQRLNDLINAVAARTCTVLIHGESGTGKEMTARCIHARSRRASRPFVPVDCTTLRDTLFESQLFGHMRGAFTGAEQPTLGFFRAADGGTLFLDEIGELPLHIQAKLLRCIQEGAVVPLGSVHPIAVNVRLVAATHRDLPQMVRRGEFREDLYYRLNVVRLEVPPLRARRDDILPLAVHFLEQQAGLYQEPVRRLSDEAIAALEAYHWPGNVRELANAVEHACALCTRETIGASDLPETVQFAASITAEPGSGRVLTLEAAERQAIMQALTVSNGNRARAAQLLQIERHRLYRKIRRYQLEHLARPIAV
jgi:two-component system response regulator HydG